MNKADFEIFVNEVVEQLRAVAKATPEEITKCKNGDDFESCVFDATKKVLEEKGSDAEILYTKGSHAFPDIIIDFHEDGKFGIEVKSSTAKKAKGWKINGNSVMGSTRDDSVIETYIIFGKTAATNLDFKAKRYEDCVANVVVTHSPRYYIDLDIPEDETFFAKSGIAYKELSESDNPIRLVTDYFLSQGQRAWWLAESSPAIFRMFNKLDDNEKRKYIGYGFAHFPELFEKGSTKYKNFAIWLVSEQSIVHPSLRDCFTAGGKVQLELNGNVYERIPQIYKTLCDHKKDIISELDSAESEELCSDWSVSKTELNSIDAKVEKWIEVVSKHIKDEQLPEDVTSEKLLSDIFK